MQAEKIQLIFAAWLRNTSFPNLERLRLYKCICIAQTSVKNIVERQYILSYTLTSLFSCYFMIFNNNVASFL